MVLSQFVQQFPAVVMRGVERKVIIKTWKDLQNANPLTRGGREVEIAKIDFSDTTGFVVAIFLHTSSPWTTVKVYARVGEVETCLFYLCPFLMRVMGAVEPLAEGVVLPRGAPVVAELPYSSLRLYTMAYVPQKLTTLTDCVVRITAELPTALFDPFSARVIEIPDTYAYVPFFFCEYYIVKDWDKVYEAFADHLLGILTKMTYLDDKRLVKLYLTMKILREVEKINPKLAREEAEKVANKLVLDKVISAVTEEVIKVLLGE